MLTRIGPMRMRRPKPPRKLCCWDHRRFGRTARALGSEGGRRHQPYRCLASAPKSLPAGSRTKSASAVEVRKRTWGSHLRHRGAHSRNTVGPLTRERYSGLALRARTSGAHSRDEKSRQGSEVDESGCNRRLFSRRGSLARSRRALANSKRPQRAGYVPHVCASSARTERLRAPSLRPECTRNASVQGVPRVRARQLCARVRGGAPPTSPDGPRP